MTIIPPALREMWVPDPVLARPTDEQIAAMVAQHGSKAPGILQGMERKRRELIAERGRDPFKAGYVPDIWRQAERLLWTLALLVIFGANRSSKTWFCVWAAMRHMVSNPKARVLFLHNDKAQSIDVHQAIFYHYLPLAWKPPVGKRIRTGDTKISYQAGDGFASEVVVLPNGSMARFGNYEQEWTRFEGAEYTLINASESFPLPLLDTLNYRLPGQGQVLRILWDFTPVLGITPAIYTVINGARCIEHGPAEHLPPDHKAMDGQDWPKGRMPRRQESPVAETQIMYFWSEDNKLAAGEALRKKMRQEKWDVVKVERRMYGYARNVTGRALPKFGKVNYRTRAELEKMGVLRRGPEIWPTDMGPPPPRLTGMEGPSTWTRRVIYDPHGARNPFIMWIACDRHGRHVTYREWPDRATFGEWAVPSKKDSKWNGDKGPAQEKIGLSVAEQKRLMLEAEGWVWNDEQKKFEEGPNGIEEIYERLIDPRAGAAERQAENEGDAETLIGIFLDEQKDAAGNIIGPSMRFEQAPGLQEEHGIEIINTKYLGYDTTAPVVPLVNEPLWLVFDECEQTIYSCLNYRPGRGKQDEACKEPVDCARYYFTGDPYFAGDGPGYFAGKGGYGG